MTDLPTPTEAEEFHAALSAIVKAIAAFDGRFNARAVAEQAEEAGAGPLTLVVVQAAATVSAAFNNVFFGDHA